MTVQSQCVVRYSTKLDKDTEAWLKAWNSFGPPAQINNAAVFNATMRKNQSEGDTFFKVVRPQMQLSRGDGTVPATAPEVNSGTHHQDGSGQGVPHRGRRRGAL